MGWSKTGIFVIYPRVVGDNRGFEIGWVVLGSYLWVVPKVKKYDPPPKVVREPPSVKVRYIGVNFGYSERYDPP